MELTREEPAPGLHIWQPARGFRYGMDPVLLAAFALDGGRPARFLDAGTGSGLIALLLARLGLVGEGVDIVPEWIELARRSAADSGLEVAFQVQDLRLRRADPVDLVLCNPPYWPLGAGPLPSEPMRAAARHELHGALSELIPALCRAGERVALVVPARRAEEAARLLAQHDRPLARRVRVDQTLVLLEGRAGAELSRDTQVHTRAAGAWSPWARAQYEMLGLRLRP